MSEVSSPSLFTATSSAAPTAFQPQPPTYVPSEAPSAAPSVEAFYFIDGSLVTQLYINQERSMNNVEHALFVGIMEGHTESIGNNLTSPFIKTYCTILNQVYGTSGDTIVLQVSYHMNYTTKYGYDIYEYPELFRIFMNENNATTLEKFVDLIDVPDWSYIQEVGTTVAVTEDNIMELITTYAPQSAPQPPFSAEGKDTKLENTSNGSHPSSLIHNSSLDSDLPASSSSSSSSSSKREDTLVGVLLGFSIVILLTVVAGFIRVYRKKKQEQLRRDEGGVVLTTDTEDQRALEDSNTATALAAVLITNSLDQPPSEETTPSSSIAHEKEIILKDDDSSIMNDAIFTFALPIDVSDAEKGIITALDNPSAMMVDGETHHDRFSSGLSPLSFLIETDSMDEVVMGSNHEEIASLGAPLSSSITERGTVISAMEATPTAQHLQVSMSHDLHRSEIGTSSVTFAPELAQTVILEQLDDSRDPVEVSDSNDIEGYVTEEVTSPLLDHGTFAGANLMAIRSDSLSSESHDESLASQPSTGDVVDEFDKYRDHLLDVLTEEVEAAVDSVHVPLRLAIAQLFTDASEQGTAPSLDLSWIGGEDLGSIEASCLCHACAWEQNNDSSTGQTFYEDMLNKIVLIVHHGLLTPHDGARILHGCASIVGLTLLKELPNTTAVIQGLISTNELAHGHHLLVSAFEQFGEIVDASICPQNRAFGFVRFANSESIDKVLNEPSVVIQDVAVSITSLLR